MATQASLDFVQSLYVAYYGRPADTEGQVYWAERAEAEGQGAILDAFGTSEEFTQEYGDLNNDQLVNSLYQQLFNRDAEPEGQSYYADVLTNGDKSLSEIAVTIMNAAQGSDAESIEAKTEVADYYTENVTDAEYDMEVAQSVVTEVDGNSSGQEIASAKAEIDASTGDEQTPPTDGGDDNGEAPPTDEQVLVVNGDEVSADNKSFSLGENEAIRFTNVESAETINVNGLNADKAVMVENSANIILNLDTGSAASGQFDIQNSTVTVSGLDTDTLTALSVAATGDSSLNLNESIAGPLQNLEITGDSGNFELLGAVVGTAEQGAEIDASGYAGNVTIGEDVLANATRVTTGSGDDVLTVDDISGGTAAPAIDGGDGNDSLTVTGSMSPEGYIDSNVSGFESLTFESYSKVDASQLDGAETFNFQSGGDINHLASGQTVIATAAGLTDEPDGSPMILRDAGDSVNVEAVNAEGAETTLDLKVLKTDNEFTGGTMNLSGDADVRYEEAGRQFDSFDASELNGDLVYTGAAYAQENIELGSGNTELAVSSYETDSNGVRTGETFLTSKYDARDVVTGFDSSNGDTLVDLDGNTVAPVDITSDIDSTADIDAAFDVAGGNTAADNGYVSFELDGATYVYSDNDGTEGATGEDFALQLGVQDSTTTDAVA
ncbi:DUF4214 domain-containing protein [Modicisalibacter radicis]|uniref:DUF4214 domain-containing protein n=1 Tax=Halomonas sp. EAR18 TaxID=2518972 RepID=UPI0014444896|nr:DUF4214 domain-containing protein [Halomonas sp. EAR18]